MEVPILLVPKSLGKTFGKTFVGPGTYIAKFMNIEVPLKKIKSEYRPGEYAVAAVGSSIVWSFLVYILVMIVFTYKGEVFSKAVLLATLPGAASFFLFFVLHGMYPKIQAKKIGEMIDKDLVFALKDMVLHVTSGVSLYDGVKEISNAGYGFVSDEFKEVIVDVEKGMSFDEALENLALRTDSEFTKRIMWQLVNAMRAGSSIENALVTFVDSLVEYQERQIKNYTAELNMFTLMYLLFAVAIPSMGLTVLVIMSAFAGMGLNQYTFIVLVAVCVALQVVMISMVEGRRPRIEG
jgi:pilus assembly protein TadC